MLLLVLTMVGGSVGEGSDKTAPGFFQVGGWAWGQQPYLIKDCTATETSRRIYQETLRPGKLTDPLARRPMRPGSESQVYLEAARPTTTISPRTTTAIGTWNARTVYESGKTRTAQVVAEMRNCRLLILGIS